MKTIIALTILLAATSSFAKDGYEIGNCQKQAQEMANAVAKINRVQLSSVMHLQGQPTQVETYQDELGYIEITTNTGRGEGTCIVESMSFNPQP